MSFSVGETIGPYRIVEQLGQGGMATVFKAYHAALDRYVALKVLHPAFMQDPTFQARFQREARVVAKLEHANIVPIYDYAEHEGRSFLVMKFIEGETLKSRLNRGTMPVDEAIRIVEAVGAGLAYAHQQDILHRDVKPSNVLLTKEGQIYLADFGLARIASAGESTLSSDTVLGTPQYISPEQALGKHDLDAGTDIYSFGVLIYELVVGRVPFTADTPFAVIHDHIYKPLPLPRTTNPQIPEAVERVLLKALAKERQDRYVDVASLVAAFKDALQAGPLPAAAVGYPQPVGAASQSATRPVETAAQASGSGSLGMFPQTVGSSQTAAQPMAAAPVSGAGPFGMFPQPEAGSGSAPFGAFPSTSSQSAAQLAAPPSPYLAAPAAPVKPARRRRRLLWLLIPAGLLLVCGCLAAIAGLPRLRAILARANPLAPLGGRVDPLPPTPPQPLPGPTQPLPGQPQPTLGGPQPTFDPLAQAQQRVAEHPDDPAAHLELALALYDSGQTEAALAEYQTALDQGGSNYGFFAEAGQNAASRGFWLQAAQAYYKMMACHPAPVPPELQTAWQEAVYKAFGSPGAAESLPLESITQVDPSMAVVAEARQDLLNDRPLMVRLKIKTLLDQRPDYAPAQLVMAEIYYKLREPDQADIILTALQQDAAQPTWIRDEAKRLYEENHSK